MMDGLFARVEALLPTDIMADRLVIVVGCGGARVFIESLARCGVGHFVLIDGDRVSLANAATQGTFCDEVGRPKVDVLRDSLLRINPGVQVTALHRFVDDTLSDTDFETLLFGRIDRPQTVLLCGCTDNFSAQDRTVKLALKYRLPYLATQVYQEGRGAECVYMHPDISGACPRCILDVRYRAYEAGYQNTVTSLCVPYFATLRLNALEVHIALMLMLWTEQGNRFAGELRAAGQRNLVLISFDPFISDTLGIRGFARLADALPPEHTGKLLMENALWIDQPPRAAQDDRPACPYCGGTGDLHGCAARIQDTRTFGYTQKG